MGFNLEAIREVLAVSKRMDEKNLVNTLEGNISCKKDGLIYLTPTSQNKGLLTEDMIAVLNLDGEWVGGSCKPTSESPMHRITYTIRDNIGGVVHCHAPYLTAFALTNQPVECFSYPELMGNFDTIPVAPYGRPGTDDIINNARELLLTHDIVLLGNHGALAVGKTVTDAMNKMEAAEAIAKVVYLTNTMGGATPIPQEDVEFFKAVNAEKFKK